MKNKKYFKFSRFIAIMKKEVFQLLGDRVSLALPVGMTVIMMLLFGYAVNTDVDNIQTAVFDKSKTLESREFISEFKSTGYFNIIYNVSSDSELQSLIDKGSVKAGIIIPVDFATLLKENKSPKPQLLIDGSDPSVARTALNSGILIANTYSSSLRERFMDAKGMSTLKAPGVDLNTRVLYNPNMESNKFNIPGLIGLILQNITVMLTSFAMVREKERGTIEQLIVTPVTSLELILGKLVPYVVSGYGAFLLALIICRFWFKVEILGSLSLLLALGGLFVICALSIGMLISGFAKNQTQAMQLTIVILLPSALLTGFMFPVEAMPLWIKPASMVLPLTYFLHISRGIILKGVGLESIWQDALILAVFTVIILTLAVKKFKKSLD